MDRLLKRLITPLLADITGQPLRPDGSLAPIPAGQTNEGLRATVDALQVQLALAGQQMTTTSGQLSTLSGLYATSQTELVQAKAQIAALTSGAATMNGQVVTLQTLADNYTQALTASLADRQALHTSDAQLRTLVAALQARAALVYQNASTASAVPRIWTSGAALTDSAGVATVVLPAGYFSQVHFAVPVVVRATADPKLFSAAFITTAYAGSTPPSIKVQVAESKTTGVLVLNTMVEGLEAAPAGVSVYLLAVGV